MSLVYPIALQAIKDNPDRFWSKIQPPLGIGECWEWRAAKSRLGYAVFGYTTNRSMEAHRLSYRLLIGEPSSNTELDHLRRNPSCVNPYHLEAVSHRENCLRGIGMAAGHAKQTHCKNGHPLCGDNLYNSSRGQRRCKTCNRAWLKRRK